MLLRSSSPTPALSASATAAANEAIHHQGVGDNKNQLDNSDNEYNLVQTITLRSNIVDFYHDRSVLITGGSGFIGKVLIEKLLRSCETIRNIFVLVRPKWNKQPRERIQELLEAPLFDMIRNTNFQQKIIVVEGDVTKTNLGLSEQNLLKIMNEVSVIFHSAATVKFDEPLKLSVAINIAGTRNIIEVSRKIPQLAALVHVSTAYANCDRDEINEHIYPVNMSPENIIEMANWLDQETMQELKTKLLGARPNTYTYTKALAEWLLLKCAPDLPVVICRPAIVVASWREPFSGWIDNVNGPTGIILGAGKGLIRSMFADGKCVADLVPVDTVINLIITLGWFANAYQNIKQQNDTSESLAESLIGSSSGDELFDGFTEQINCLVTDRKFCNGNTMQNSVGRDTDVKENAINSKDNNNNQEGDDDASNNNNNHLNSNANFHTTDYKSGQAEGKCSPKTFMANGEERGQFVTRRQFLDDGYGSAIHSPNLTAPITSSSLTNNQQNYSSTTSASETSSINNNQIESDQLRVLSFVAQRRLAEQKQAAFDYKLKQFRHNTQVKLTAQNLPEEIADIPVFHCTSGSQNPITWNRIQVIIMTILSIYPSIATYRYPNGAFTNNERLDDFYRITLHYIPGYIVDFITRLMGGKPTLVKIFRKYDQAANVLKAFTSRQWKFNSDNRLMLINELMSDEDRRLFNCDLKSLDWTDYLTNYVLGVRKFMLKEPIDNVERARANLRIVYYRNLSLQILFLAILAYYTFTINLFN